MDAVLRNLGAGGGALEKQVALAGISCESGGAFELGAGFDADSSARENIFINAALYHRIRFAVVDTVVYLDLPAGDARRWAALGTAAVSRFAAGSCQADWSAASSP